MATETTPPNSLQAGKAFDQAASNQKQPSKLPASIDKTAPKLTLEMPGPIGTSVRKAEAQKQFSKDYVSSNVARAKNYADKSKSSTVISKDNVKEGTKGLLGQQFNDKSRGLDR